MNRFKDQKAREAYEMRFTRGLPKHVSIKTHEKVRVLIAAHGAYKT